jgi:P4 family phage/plasmid primase-like protien
MEKVMSDQLTEAEHHLNTWLSGINKGFVSFFEMPSKKVTHVPVNQLKETLPELMKRAERQNLYYGLATRKEMLSEYQRGTNKDVSYLPGAWVEVDIKGGTHASENLPSMEQYKMIQDTIGIEPSIVIFSGGGLHVYFLFDEPVRVQFDHERESAQRFLKRFQGMFIGLAKSQGLHIDNTSDIARVLRVPGTFNLKGERKAVKTLKMNPEARYSLKELKETIERVESMMPKEKRERKTYENSTSELPDAKLEPILNECNFMKSCYEEQESLSYNPWVAGLSIAAYCEDPETACHMLSEKHPNYSEAETDKKIAEIRANMKPRTCASLSDEFGKCASCKHNGKINSPIALGMKLAKPEKKQSFKKTDYGNAERLIDRHGENLRFCPPFGRWFIWDNTKWLEDIKNEVEGMAKETVRNMYKEAYEMEDADMRQELSKHAMKSESLPRLKAMVSLAESEKGIPILPEELDQDLWKLNCLNGTLDLKTGKLLPHNRDDLITKQIAVRYDPAAECPNWMNFLEFIMKDEQGNVKRDLIEFLQKAVGYSLTGSIREQAMFILHGEGRNGKSTFINTIKDLLGSYASQANTDTFMVKKGETINNDIAALKGARMVSAVETEEGKRLAESLVKQLTGGEAIKARFMRQDFFEYLPQYKIFLTTNHKPNIAGTDTGIWRRIRLIPFSVIIPENQIDLRLDEKLKAEYPGILRWAVEGCMKWLHEGLGIPEEIKAATKEYRDEMDVTKGFLEECCSIHPSLQVTTKSLYKAYQDWCAENGEYHLTKRKFTDKVKSVMAADGLILRDTRIGAKSDRGYNGIGLLN